MNGSANKRAQSPKPMAAAVSVASCFLWLAMIQLGTCTASSSPILTVGSVRVSVLTDRVLRVEWSSKSTFDDLPSTTVVNRQPDASLAFNVTHNASHLHLSTAYLELTYAAGAQPQLQPPSCEQLNITVLATDTAAAVTWCPGMGVAPATQRNLNGSLETTDCYVGWRRCLDVYSAKMQPGVVSRSGYAVINDTSAVLLKELGKWPEGWRTPRPHGPGLYEDLIFLGHGHAYRDAMRDYRYIGGPVPLMPWRAYGNWWSRYHRYSAESLKQEVLDGFANWSLPLHMLVLDTDWHTGAGYDPQTNCSRKLQEGYNWNYTLFPSPKQFQAEMHGRNLSMVLNLHDQGNIDRCQNQYAAVMRAENQSEAAISQGTWLHCSFEDESWSSSVHSLMLERGDNEAIDAWWTDFGGAPGGSPVANFSGNSMWQCGRDTHPVGITGVIPASFSPGHGYLDVGFQYGNGRTPGSLWAQAHRYPLVGSGDTEASWGTMAYFTYMNIAGANVGTSWTHDVGAFYARPPFGRCAPGDSLHDVNSCEHTLCSAAPGNATTAGTCMHSPELHLRWLQHAVWSPVLRPHCESCEIRPWMFPEQFRGRMARAYHLRAALMPYHYSSAFKAYQTGVVTMHPLYYDWPVDEEAYQLSQFSFDDQTNTTSQLEYCFGDDFVVAPVFGPISERSGTVNQTVWIPPGSWIRWHTSESVEGPLLLSLQSSLDDMPVYVRAGAIIPLSNVSADTMSLVVMPFSHTSAADHTFSLYEDDGVGLGFQTRGFRVTNLTHVQRAEQSVTLRIMPHVMGHGYLGEATSRVYHVEYRSDAKPRSVTVNGTTIPHQTVAGLAGWWESKGCKELSCPYDSPSIMVRTREMDAAMTIEIVLHY